MVQQGHLNDNIKNKTIDKDYKYNVNCTLEEEAENQYSCSN